MKNEKQDLLDDLLYSNKLDYKTYQELSNKLFNLEEEKSKSKQVQIKDINYLDITNKAMLKLILLLICNTLLVILKIWFYCTYC